MDQLALKREYARLMHELSDAYARHGIAGDLAANREKAYQIRQMLALVFNEGV